MRGLTNQPRVLGRTLSVAVILFKPTRVSEFVEISTQRLRRIVVARIREPASSVNSSHKSKYHKLVK